jgi:hypothetical protein
MKTRFSVKALLLGIAALAASVFLTPPASASPATWAPAVCMVNAPNSTVGLGHVGWAIREETNRWAIGATEGSGAGDNWDRFDVTDAQFHQIFRDKGNYSTFRCRGASAGLQNAWSNWQAAKQRGYNLFSDNCLTRAVDLMNQMGLGLKSAAGWAPNIYYDQVLNDWGFAGRENI